MKIQKISKKAFTLIELMIVVVILWVLMSTILPKLTWAQARARDIARVSDLLNISTALQTYYDDNGDYPWTWSSLLWECLDGEWWVWSAIKVYMQNGTIPVDPQLSANSHMCMTTSWRYYYAPLTKDWLTRNSFVLCADMETYQKSNTNASLLVWETAVQAWSIKDNDGDLNTTDNDYEDVLGNDTTPRINGLKTNAQKETADENASYTVYCILRP